MIDGVAECVQSHVGWMTAKAFATGGRRGREEGIDWAWIPAEGTVHLLFPVHPTATAVAAVATIADGLGARSTALWSAEDDRREWLDALGFEPGWQPWWMTAGPADIPSSPSPRVTVTAVDAPAVVGGTVLRADAHEDGHTAGGAWLHLEDGVAGLYDMEVRPAFQRRGLGRELLSALVTEAQARGARVVTLNATPEGERLYTACGFRHVGVGRTWWRHALR